MTITYFVTYPLMFLFFCLFLFFVYCIVRAGNDGVKISPTEARQAQGQIVSIRSSTGENSAFLNVIIKVTFLTSDNKSVVSEGKAVIDAVKLAEYQKGCSVPLIYSLSDPTKIKLQIRSSLEERLKRE